jgi:pantoate--beta-alanine ligase
MIAHMYVNSVGLFIPHCYIDIKPKYMWIARTIEDARTRRRAAPGRVALVPTMGALHAGHVSLIEAARALADTVVVSVFVNPTQFGPHEDFNRYPRPIDADLAACEAAGAAGVFHPSVDDMYPPESPGCELTVPALTHDLEGALRPGHFAGVCRVVAKLFNIVQPEVACFGMKDYQQLAVVTAMTADLNLPIRIVACLTRREDDGLAMSSRNRYLDADQRRRAVGLHKALLQAKQMVEAEAAADPQEVELAMRRVIEAHRFDAIDYAVVRHPRTLAPLDALAPGLTGGVVALVAARMGATRLIDNMLLARSAG